MITKEEIINTRNEMLELSSNPDAYEFAMCVCRHLDIWHKDGICIACATQFLFLCENFRPLRYKIEINI